MRRTIAENIHAESGIYKKKTVPYCLKEKLNHIQLVFHFKYLTKIENNVLFLNLLKDKIKDPVCLFFI